jgi:hypothetical protein
MVPPHLPLNSAHFSLPPASAFFFLALFANPEDGGYKESFIRNFCQKVKQ